MSKLLTLFAPTRPDHIPDLKLWLDANDGPKTGGAAQFTAANSESLSIADNASLNLSGSDVSWNIWFYLDDLDNCGIFFQNGGAGSRSWLLDLSSSTLRFTGSPNGTAQVTITSLATLSTATWYHLAVRYRLSDGRLEMFLNGVSQDVDTLSGGLFNGSTSVTIGGTSTIYTDGRASRAFITKKYLSDAEVTWLYNSGAGRTYEDFGNGSNDGADLLTHLVSYWKLGEVSGTRSDSHGTNHLTDNNTVTWAEGPSLIPAYEGSVIRQWNDKSGQGINPALITVTAAPVLKVSIINGKSVLRFDGDDYLKYATAPLVSTEGSIFAVVRPNSVLSAQAILSQADEASATRYALFGGRVSTNYRPYLAHHDGTTNNTIYGSSTLATATNYLLEYHSSGADYDMLANLVDQTFLVASGSDNGNWFGDASAQDHLMVGATFVNSALGNYFSGDIAEILVYSRNLTASERARVRRYLSLKYGLGLAA